MAKPRQLDLRSDGSWQPTQSPLARSRRGRLDAAKAAIEHADRDHQSDVKRTRDPANQPAETRRAVAKLTLQVPGEFDRELDRLRERFGLTDEDAQLVLRAAADRRGSLADGLIDVALEHGRHDLAEEVAELYNLELDVQAELDQSEDPNVQQILGEIDALKRAGLDEPDVDQALQLARDMGGGDAAVVVAGAFLARETGREEIVDRLADVLEVDVDRLENAIDQAEDAGHLDADDLEPDDDFDDQDQDEDDEDGDYYADDQDGDDYDDHEGLDGDDAGPDPSSPAAWAPGLNGGGDSTAAGGAGGE